MSGNTQSRAALNSMEQKVLRLFGDVFVELVNDAKVSIIHSIVYQFGFENTNT